jgi:hypothetical protein
MEEDFWSDVVMFALGGSLATVTQVTAGFMFTAGANILCWELYAGSGGKNTEI